jgi:tetratricopeptide (TPR) repeat protein
MAGRSYAIWFVEILLGISSVTLCAMAQGSVKLPPQTDNSRFESITTYDVRSFIISGRVALPDGSPPSKLVLVERVCRGITQMGGFADSKGHFSFDLGVLNRDLAKGSTIDYQSSHQLAGNQIKPEDLISCEVRASLAGYRSDSLSLTSADKSPKQQLGTIVLMPLVNGDAALTSSNDGQVPKNARRAYEKGMDAAAEAKWSEAINSFEKATSLYPGYSTGWLSLGMLQGASNNTKAALVSFRHAMDADPNFVLPYLESAIVENTIREPEKVLEYASKAIQISPGSFPIAYLLNGWANLNLRRYDEAAKSVEEGIKLDKEHHYPDLEFVAGLALLGKGDPEGAEAQLKAYLALAPFGANAAQAQRRLSLLHPGR